MRHSRILHRTTFLSLASLATLAPPAGVAQSRATTAPADAIRIPFERVTLPNGLDVILAPDHSTPQVAVDVWYHVGSKNEAPGKTGFAHLFEHVMFTGSGHVPYGMHDRLTQGIGGNNNGSTTNDRTNYYENIPSNYLETALWLESDRMGFLLDKLDSAKFVAQRDIVQNERRQGTDNQPYGRAWEILTAALYAEANPYSWPVVGYMADLQRASLDDVKSFFRLYYAPTNATIAIVGDFQPEDAKRMVTKYFGGLPRGGRIQPPTVTREALAAPKRLVFEDRVQVPQLYVFWPTVSEKHDDTFALTFLAEILTASRTARLTKALVYDRQSAANVSAFQQGMEGVGDFGIVITPRPEHTLTAIEAETDSVIERLKREGPTADEMAKAGAGLEFSLVSSLESNLGKAEMLNAGLVFHGDPGWFRTQYTKMRAVTAADVRRVANTYLGSRRVVLSIVPIGQTGQAAKPESSTRVTVSPDGAHYIMGSAR
jgi:zinc protease